MLSLGVDVFGSTYLTRTINLHYENEQDIQMSSQIHEENGDGHDSDSLRVNCTYGVSLSQ